MSMSMSMSTSTSTSMSMPMSMSVSVSICIDLMYSTVDLPTLSQANTNTCQPTAPPPVPCARWSVRRRGSATGRSMVRSRSTRPAAWATPCADKRVYCHEALHLKEKLQLAGYKQAEENSHTGTLSTDSDSDESTPGHVGQGGERRSRCCICACLLVCAVGVERGFVYLPFRERIRRMARGFSVLNTRIIRAPQPSV